MAFARLETEILNHRKFTPLFRLDVRANDHLAAFGAYALFLAYSADQLSDGRVPKAWVKTRLRANVIERSAELLQGVGLLEDRGDHYMIHDYLEWNPTSDQIKADREAARERMRRLRGQSPRSQERKGSDVRSNRSVRDKTETETETEITPPRTRSYVRANGHDPTRMLDAYLERTGRLHPDDMRQLLEAVHTWPPGQQPFTIGQIWYRDGKWHRRPA